MRAEATKPPAIQIEILSIEGCPNAPRAFERVRGVVAALDVRARIVGREIRDYDDAAQCHFLGSPTIRVDGVDVEPPADANAVPAVTCRIYGSEGVPSREHIEQAIRRRLP